MSRDHVDTATGAVFRNHHALRRIRKSTSQRLRANASQLANWPVQLHLLSPLAPFLRGADLLLVADCVPFACADFHSRILDGRPVAIGCPKLDDGQAYVQKLSQIIHTAQVRSITVVHMEVPCCTGLLRIAEAAVQQAASDIPVRSVIVTVRGQVMVPTASGCWALETPCETDSRTIDQETAAAYTREQTRTPSQHLTRPTDSSAGVGHEDGRWADQRPVLATIW